MAALEHGRDRLNADFPISNRLLRDMHGLLLRSGRGSDKMPGIETPFGCRITDKE